MEWNVGVFGHSPFTTAPLFTAKLSLPDGTPVLRMYEYERIRQVTWQMDFWLGEEDRFLFGMEESCGYLTGTAVRDKDGVLGSLLICQMFCDHRGRGLTLMDGLAELSARFGAFVESQQAMAFERGAGAGGRQGTGVWGAVFGPRGQRQFGRAVPKT